ncbi:Fibronectin type III domain protein [Minicystis rosea]|nr:Fibronectin type III domain protein [Minicystis rosea]
MALMRARQKAVGYDFARDAGGTIRSKAGAHEATAEVAVTARGVHLSGADHGSFELGIETTSVGREAVPTSRGVLQQRAEGQELVLDREDGVEERYLAGPLGVEQSYLVREKQAGGGPLVIAVAFAGLVPKMADGAMDRVLLVDAEGRARGGYRDLVVADAEGREIAAHMEVRGPRVALVIDDAAAIYPLRVDPLVWLQQQKLTASDGAFGDRFGASVAISGDTAIIGAYADNSKGSAYAFVRSGGTWIQQGKLMAANGQVDDEFGQAVAISGDTAVIGARLDNTKGSHAGAAYVFVRSGSVWTQQQKLTASDGTASDVFGVSVAVSGDTALIGAWAKASFKGAAYAFVRSGNVWIQQQKLLAPDGTADDDFGISVALSGDTALIGAHGDDSMGSARVFVRSGGTWTQQQKLTASDGALIDNFGCSVAVSGDTALVGAYGKASLTGAAYVFVRSGSVWAQQQKLTASDGAPNDSFGFSVAVSGDAAVVGAYQDGDNGTNSGSAYVFARSGSVWSQQQKLIASDPAANESFGISVAVSSDTAMIGADQDNTQGAAYVFAAKAGNGTTCTSASACASGFCVDGVCCDTACNGGACDACSTAAGAPSNGTCALLTGTACNDGNACTQNDTCQAGVCTGGSPVTCTASDACHVAGTCDPATGACSNPNAANGTSCNDGNACTQSDTCQSGVCTGGTPITCAASGPCHVAGTCDPATGACSNPIAANGTSCNDGDACTQTDTCQAGVCTGGNPVTCTASDACHVAGTCNPETGLCSNPNAANGTSCNDGNACSKNDVCTNGACGGTAYVCTPTSCQASSTCDGNGGCTIVNKGAGAACPDDGNACTDDACDGAGACQHGNKADGTSCGAGLVCVGGSCAGNCFIGGTLYTAGTVNPANACLWCSPQSSTTAWSNRVDGTACNDGNACTKSDVCTAGTCGGTAYTCTATSCQQSSACDGNGGCTIVNKPSGTACPDDGNACSTDTCNGAGTCTHSMLADGTSCGAGQLCEGGSCGMKCQIGGQLYAAGTINPANACERCAPATSTSTWSARADGTSCDDGNACTKSDVCTAGVCGGAAYTCSPGICDATSICNGNGGCTVTPKGSGVACPDDGNPCTADACNGAGACAHPTLADGTTCAAGQVCSGGACAADCFIGGALVAAGAVNPANACEVCAPATSTTSWSNKADGAACDDGNACTQTDVCQTGVCMGGNPVSCTASDQCHDVGSCDSATGQCSNPAKTDGVSCDDGDACSQTDSCMGGVCVGGNVKTCKPTDECHVEGTCDKGTGDCSAPAKADGEACSMGTCQSGVCKEATDGGMGGSGGSGGDGGSSATSSGNMPGQEGSCSCRAAGADESAERGPMGLVVGLMLMAGVSRRRSRSMRRAA